MKTNSFINILKSSAVLGLCFLMTIIGTTFQGCADLDPDPLEFNLPPESFGSLEEMDRGIIGVYRSVSLAARMTTFYAPAWGGDERSGADDGLLAYTSRSKLHAAT